MKEFRLKIVDFGDGSKVSAQLSLKQAGHDFEITSRSKLVPAGTTDSVPPDIDPTDFPDEPHIHYLPSDPAAWAWLVGTWITLRVAEHLVEDAYEAIKRTIADVRREYPRARITLSEETKKAKRRRKPRR